MKKLLVIDDNLDFLGFLTSALEKYFEVYTATGVKVRCDCWNIKKSKQFVLIII